MSSSKSKLEKAFQEVYTNIPKNVKKTGKTGKAKNKMLQAIAFSKARQAGAHIPSYDKGGVVKETGLALVHKGETVVPNKGDKLNVQTREAQESPDSKFNKGSEGSKIETGNYCPCTPPDYSTDAVMRGSRGNEKQEQHRKGEHNSELLKETDHPYESLPVINNLIHKDSPELVRRKNAKARDERTGYRITDNRVYPDNA